MSIPPLELIRRFDIPGPCYASYPTADRFVEAFTAEQMSQVMAQRREGAAVLRQPLSLHVHIPFCESLCYYCACSQVVTKQRTRAETYLRYLGREVDLYAAHLGLGQAVSQLHLGGGTPTFLSDDHLRGLMAMLRRSFKFSSDGDYSIEVDPRSVDAARLATLAELGFGRLSLGVQDFDPAVQKAVHRVQPAEQVFGLMAAARALGFKSVAVDLMYGLPLQTPESFDRTLEQVVQLRPDRVALYAYSHLPERHKPQRRIAVAELPPPQARLTMLSRSMAALLQAGYVHVGMEHFALPGDALAVARRQGRLHRSFQGYSTQPDGDLISLGVSAIGRMGAAYSQNAKTLEAYYDCLDQGRLPVVQGLALSRDDLVRRAVIMALLCQGRLDFESIELAYLIDFKHYFSAELDALRDLQEQRLVELGDNAINVTDMGWFFVRGLAAVFDRYLQADRTRARFSRII
ncbi:MAG: oxygen-independent coproporphyrinogen III oxidase [Polaromonas sp.]